MEIAPIKIINKGHPVTTEITWHGMPTREVTNVDFGGEVDGTVKAELLVYAEVDVYATYNWSLVAREYKRLTGEDFTASLVPRNITSLTLYVHLKAPMAAHLAMMMLPNGSTFRWIGYKRLHLDKRRCEVDLLFPNIKPGDPAKYVTEYTLELSALLNGLHYPELDHAGNTG
jgi:hypothetical protein